MNGTVGHVDVTCPACGQVVRVQIVAREHGVADGALQVGLEPRWSHECPPPDGERLAS